MCIPGAFSLPNLECLALSKLTFDDLEGVSINELLQGCPALKDLSLSGCNMWNLENLFIRAPLLKRLLIEQSLMDSGFEVILDAPNLKGLTYSDCVAGSYFLRDFKCLVTAHIDVGPSQQQLDEMAEDGDEEDLWYCDEVANLVRACSSTTCLYLAACSIGALRYSSVPLPVFKNLSWLSLGCLGVYCEFLALLLLSAPCLEKLSLEEGFGKNEEGFEIFQNSLPGTPTCLELHMKIIELWVFTEDKSESESESEIKLIEYFLKNGQVLEKLVLHCLPPDDASIISRLLMLPRHSEKCQISFEWKVEWQN